MDFTNLACLYAALILIVALPVAGFFMFWRRKAEYRAFGSWEAVQKLTQHLSSTRRLVKIILIMSGLLLLTVALSGPQWGSRMVEVRRQGLDVLIALDVSRSMLAEDVKPNRLQRAQQELTSLIDHLKGDRVGIIAFAGNAQIACPLTTDYEAAKMFLNYLTPDSITIPGTSIGDAIRLAVSTYPKGSEGFRVLVLLTDGEDHHSNPEEAAQAAKAAGIRILSIGFGTPAGEPIPIRDDAGRVTGYIKDAAGKSVVSKLGESLLKEITETTQGVYWPSATGSLESENLAAIIGQMQKRDISAGQYGAYEDRFQFALLPGLLLILAGLWLPQRRRAWLFLLPFIFLAAATPARADVGSDVNQGNRAYGKQRYEQALQKYQDAQIKDPESVVVQYDLGNALHKLEKYEEADAAYQHAVKAKEPKLREEARYNLGNNFFQQKKFAEAIEQYKQALKLNPHDEDAQQNMALALRFLKKPPEEKNQSSPTSLIKKRAKAKAGKARERIRTKPRRKTAQGKGTKNHKGPKALMTKGNSRQARKMNSKLRKTGRVRNAFPNPGK